MALEHEIAELAREIGFDLFGVAPLRPPKDAARFRDWLREGRNGGLQYLEADAERILDPARMVPGGRSILVLGMAHSRAPVELPGGGRVARYAAGRDYHNVVVKKLRRLLRQLKQRGLVREARTLVDAGPLFERSHAEEAGLGFASKAANLLHPAYGPWFFLGEVLVDLELEPSPAVDFGSCGSCTACLDACPTSAILEPGVVDARLCLSYHTIENPGRIPPPIREKLGSWAFGCDVCSEVCPWGRKAPELGERFGTHRFLEEGLLGWLERLEDFEVRAEGSPLRRPGREGMARNAALALARQPGEPQLRGLLQALASDPSPIVREAAGWSLAQGFGSDSRSRSALERAMREDPEPENRSWLRSWRERCGNSTSS
ncbi:MAG: tRNA epoxyqueuosine(34) reductase QueG [Planctomycetes bacterium]|nr:tRNA epoxyqueuosine(34) reductase QueG [Planctomycetota bacterium]